MSIEVCVIVKMTAVGLNNLASVTVLDIYSSIIDKSGKKLFHLHSSESDCYAVQCYSGRVIPLTITFALLQR